MPLSAAPQPFEPIETKLLKRELVEKVLKMKAPVVFKNADQLTKLPEDIQREILMKKTEEDPWAALINEGSYRAHPLYEEIRNLAEALLMEENLRLERKQLKNTIGHEAVQIAA